MNAARPAAAALPSLRGLSAIAVLTLLSGVFMAWPAPAGEHAGCAARAAGLFSDRNPTARADMERRAERLMGSERPAVRTGTAPTLFE